MTTPLNVLLVEDSPNDAELLIAELKRSGFEPRWHRVETERDFLAGLKNSPDIIISDYSMPVFSGLKAVELLNRQGLNIPFILISGTVGEDVAVEAMRHGATDYLLKDRMARLGHAVERALDQQRLRAERRRTEESLKLFRTLIDRSNDGIEVIDPETGRILDVNDTGCQRLGYTRGELLAMSVSDVEVESVDISTWAAMASEIRRAGFKTVEGRQKRKDGSTFPVEINVRHVRLDRDYLIAAVRDITERKKTEAVLRASEGRLRLVTDNAQVGLVMVDAHRRYTFANGTYAEIMGLPSPDIVGRGVAEILAPVYEEQIRPRLDEAFAGKRVAYELRRPLAGRDHFYAVRYEPMMAEGLVVVVITEITERKEAEAEIQRQLAELQRWHEAMMGREDRILQLKGEINEILAGQGLPPRYPETTAL